MFVPFTPVGRAIEVKAIDLKSRARLDWYAPVDPLALLAAVPATLLLEADLRALDRALADILFVAAVDDWSAFAVPASDSGVPAKIVLNSRHAETRRRASLMEEIAHLMLGHPPSKLRIGPDRVATSRTHNGVVEQEAYDVGAACLVPYAPLFEAIRYRSVRVGELALLFGVSEDLIWYRIRRSGLSAVYRKRCG